MTLDEFKTIYWWEWTHRLLARLVGAAFLLPFLFFLWRGWIEPALRVRLWAMFGARRAARRGRLVDGVVGTGRTRQRVAVPARVSSDARLRDLCGDRVDRAAHWMPQRPRAMSRRALRMSALALLVLVICADLSRRAGRRPRCRPDLQHLAADRRRLHPVARAAVVRDAAVAQFVREHADGAVQSPHGRPMRCGCWRCCTPSMPRARAGAGRRSPARWRWRRPSRVQAALGIVTLLHQAPIGLALAHQAMAIVVLTIAVVHAERLAPRRPADGSHRWRILTPGCAAVEQAA